MNAMLEQWQQAGKLGGETCTALALRLLRGMEQFSEYQFTSLRKGLQAGAAAAQAMLAGDARQHDKLAAPRFMSLAMPAADQPQAYLQGLQQLSAEVQRDLTAIVESHQQALSHKTAQALQQARAKAPAGAELMVATVQSMLDAGNQAFQQATTMSRQIGALAERTNTADSAVPAADSATRAAA